MSNLSLFSKALYSSWGLHTPTRTLFDCGEGCATALGNYVYQPERILIGHGHGDHVLGLPSFIGCRNSGRGDKSKPLAVYAPASHAFSDLKSFISKRNSHLTYKLDFIDIVPGFRVPINPKVYIEAFAVKHTYGSVGFKVMENRTRLKAGILPEEVKARKAAGEHIHEAYDANIFSWTLDSASYDLSNIEGCAHLIADGTFLREADREDATHASVEEVLGWAVGAKVKRISIAHISTRYDWNEVRDFINKEVARVGYTGVVDIILSDHVYDL